MQWINRKFGRLKVRHLLPPDRFRHNYACCLCDCGATVRVRIAKLVSGRQKSCGCWRADSEIRHCARLKVPRNKRKAIAQSGAEASRRKPHRSPYCLDSKRAAELLGVSTERIEIMAKDGLLGFRYRNHTLFVGAEDVAQLLAEQSRQKKRCQKETELLLSR